MMTREQILRIVEGRIDTIQSLYVECIELIYNAGYNAAIEDAANLIKEPTEEGKLYANTIRELKK